MTSTPLQKKEKENDYIHNMQIIKDFSSIIPTVIMQMTETDLDDIRRFAKFYPEWVSGKDYKRNWIIQYNEKLYRVGLDHTSQPQWVPGADGTDSLYSQIEFQNEYEVWQQYDGVSGVYAKDQIVVDPTDSQRYKSKIDNNVWGPPSEQPDYWELYIES